MATKKPAKTPATDDSQPSAPAQAAKARPFAESPAPEHCRVDPESAATEYMKSLLPPDAPLPVFSTMALMHGQKAFAADKVRPGFAWNPQMDLLWALGFPEVRLVVDGFPAEDSKEAILKFWDPDGRLPTQWWLNVICEQPVLPRRGALALLHWYTNGVDPFRLPAGEFLKLTQFSPVSADEVIRVMAVAKPTYLEDTAFVLESLAGPDPVAAALFPLLDVPNVQYQALICLASVMRRLTADGNGQARDTLRAISFEGKCKRFRDRLLNLETAEWDGLSFNDLNDLTRVDASPEFTLEAAAPQSKTVYCPPRSAFTGPVEMLDLMASRSSGYDKQDAAWDFEHSLTTLSTDRLLAAELTLLSNKEMRPKLTPWFQAHIARLRQPLAAIVSDQKVGKRARDLLKLVP